MMTDEIGMAEVDITPDYPIRLSGYGARRETTDRIESRLCARALAMGKEHPALLLTVENCGVTDAFTAYVAARIKAQAGVSRERIVICYSHTHTGPCLTGAAPMLFGMDIPDDQQKVIDRYTQQLADRLIEIALTALDDRCPARLSWTQGRAGFAANRRTENGPVDHIMPVLRITDTDGNLRGVWLSYACHCTTLGPDDNFICGDWAGYAQEAIEQDHPGATAFVSIGCAADANPSPRTGLEYARQHGEVIAKEVSRLLTGDFIPLDDPPACRLERVALPFDTLPTREAWQAKVEADGPAGYHAGKFLKWLDRGEPIPDHVSYPIQTWTFGNDLTMVFMASEVVVDFPLRLREMFDPARLWLGAYANAFPGYIPSRRIWQEGGYEGGDAMIYFGLPTRYAEHVEELVVDTVQRMIPEKYRTEA